MYVPLFQHLLFKLAFQSLSQSLLYGFSVLILHIIVFTHSSEPSLSNSPSNNNLSGLNIALSLPCTLVGVLCCPVPALYSGGRSVLPCPCPVLWWALCVALPLSCTRVGALCCPAPALYSGGRSVLPCPCPVLWWALCVALPLSCTLVGALCCPAPALYSGGRSTPVLSFVSLCSCSSRCVQLCGR